MSTGQQPSADRDATTPRHAADEDLAPRDDQAANLQGGGIRGQAPIEPKPLRK